MNDVDQFDALRIALTHAAVKVDRIARNCLKRGLYDLAEDVHAEAVALRNGEFLADMYIRIIKENRLKYAFVERKQPHETQ